MMAVISLPLASMVPATASIIALRMQTSTEVPIVPWKMNGLKIYEREERSLSTSYRTMWEHHYAPIELESLGTSTAKGMSKSSRTKRRAKPVENDKLDVLGPLMSEIGQELADIVGGDPNGVFLYVEIGEGWVRPSIFKDEGNTMTWLIQV